MRDGAARSGVAGVKAAGIPEVPRRLTPTADTLRELFLRSGNVCAFPGCDGRIINDEGCYIGELCHIEAAMPGGERFNSNSSNEERRSASNLMLMCHEHHVVTDDVGDYKVRRLRKMKAVHERKFSGAVERMTAAFEDQTKLVPITPLRTLRRLDTVLEWNLSDKDLADTAASLARFVERLAPLPIPTREFLTVVVERGDLAERGKAASAMFADVQHACRRTVSDMHEQLTILEHHNVASFDEGWDDIPASIRLRGPEEGWPAWQALRDFAQSTHTPLQRLLVDLRFDLLDG